jgi:2-hydroxychromene-2-carboxylate isomerase
VTLRPWMLAALLLLAGLAGGVAAFALQALRPPAGDVRAYLLAHPEVLPEAMAKLQERETGRPNNATIAAAAAKAGLDIAQARAAAASPQVAAELDKNLKTAGALGMTGTPAWVIGDRVISGGIGQEQLAEAVKAARARGQG